MNKTLVWFGVAAAAAGVCVACTRDLSTTAGVAVAVNDSRLAVGVTYTSSGERATKFPADGAAAELALPSGCQASFATAISNRGEIAGWCSIDGRKHLIHWDVTGTAHDLGAMGIMVELRVADINDSGLIVGSVYALDGSGAARGWVYDTTARMRIDLPGVPYGRSWSAEGINERGEIAGSVELMTLERYAIKWSPLARTITRLRSDSRCTHMSASGINSAGSVVGQCGLPGNGTNPVVWPADGGAPRLLETQNEVDYYGTSINDEGTVVGVRDDAAGTTPAFHAVRWSPDGARTTYAVPFTFANAINNFGYTVGARYLGSLSGEQRPIAITW